MKVCVIGVGRMGRRHIAAARGAGLSLAGIFDQSADAVAAAVAECNVSTDQVFHDPREMLRIVGPDAVVVSTTAPSHSEFVCASAEAGARYIVCEKPMASSLEQCDQMIAACEAVGAKLAVNHQMRFMEQYTYIKALANSPEFGGLRSVVVTAANFGLAMNGVHYFEAFRFLTDEMLRTISCWFDPGNVPNPRGAQYVDRSGQLRGVSASGIRLIMELGSDLGHGIEVVYGCRYGQIVVDELSGSMRAVHRNAEYRDLPTTRYGMPATEIRRTIAPADVIKPTEALWRAMIGGESYPDGAAGRHTLAALVAANISGEDQGRAVNLAELPVSRSFMWA